MKQFLAAFVCSAFCALFVNDSVLAKGEPPEPQQSPANNDAPSPAEVDETVRLLLAIQHLKGVIHFDSSGKFDAKAGEDVFGRVVTVDFAYQSRGPHGPSNVNDEDLVHLDALRDLVTLEIGRNAITDKGLVHLRRLSQLKTLYLYNTEVKGPGLAHFTGLKRLTSLSLDHTPLTDVGLAHIGNMPHLTWLRLSHTRISNKGVESLGALKNLKTLSLAYTDISDAALETLWDLKQLESLSLVGTRVTAGAVKVFEKAVPKCKVFVSYGLGLKPKTLVFWDEDQALTSDEIAAKIRELVNDGDVEIDDSRPDKPIVALRIFGSQLSDETARHILRRMPQLETLNFRRVMFGDGLLPEVGRLTNLRYLSLKSSQVTDEGMLHLASLRNLQELILDDTIVTDAGISQLKNLTSLERLYVRDTRVAYEGIERLRQALPNCQIYF